MTERIITDRNGRKYITTEPEPQQTAATCPRKSPVSGYSCVSCGNGPCRVELQTQAAATDIHSCSYHCDRPACIKAQRAELLAELDKHAARIQEIETAFKFAADNNFTIEFGKQRAIVKTNSLTRTLYRVYADSKHPDRSSLDCAIAAIGDAIQQEQKP